MSEGIRRVGRVRQPLWRRIDPLVYIVGVTALVVYVLHGFEGVLTQDLAIYSYAGQQVAEGVPPYLGILNRVGPLAHFIPAIGVAGARLGGFDDLLGIRLVFMLLAVACVSLVYMLARELFASRLAGLVAATAFLSFYGFIEFATYGPREKTPMVLFLLCTLLAVAKRRWLAAGISASLTALVWQPALLVGLAAAITTLIALRSSERIPALVRFVVGALVPALISVIYFTVVGALHEFIDAFLLINIQYTESSPLMSHFAKSWMNLQQGYGISVWVLVVGLPALAILTFLAIYRERWRAPALIPVAAVGAASFVAIWWSFRDFNKWPDAFVLLPLAAIGVGGIAKELFERVPTRAALSLSLVWTVFAVAVAVTFSTTHRDYDLRRQRDSVATMLAQLPGDASIQSIKAPQPLVLSGTTNPTRHQSFGRGLHRYVDDTWPGGLAGFAEWIGREEPTTIALGGRRIPRWLGKTLKREFVLEGHAEGWVWYVHRSVDRS